MIQKAAAEIDSIKKNGFKSVDIGKQAETQ